MDQIIYLFMSPPLLSPFIRLSGLVSKESNLVGRDKARCGITNEAVLFFFIFIFLKPVRTQ